MGFDDLAELGTALQQSEALDFDNAWTMPKNYYTRSAVLEFEREHLFGREWICIGHVEEIAKPGDYMAFQLCDEPIVLVRGEDEKVGSCQMSADIVVLFSPKARDTATDWSAPTITGPHLEGKLTGAPGMDAHKSFEKSDCHLPQFASEEWHGFLFANVSRVPPPARLGSRAWIPSSEIITWNSRNCTGSPTRSGTRTGNV